MRTAPKAPLCKGGCQKSLIFDWGIVILRQPLRSKSSILTTSPYTGEARASRSILPDKHQFAEVFQKTGNDRLAVPCKIRRFSSGIRQYSADMLMDYCCSAAFAARSAFHAAIFARFSASMSQIKRNASQEPMPMMAGIRMHIALIPKIAEAGWFIPAPA